MLEAQYRVTAGRWILSQLIRSYSGRDHMDGDVTQKGRGDLSVLP